MNSPNIFPHDAFITREMREKLNNHKSIVVWFTGLSGSGKSTLAHSLEEKLYKLGCKAFVIDGDNTRKGLSSDLNFSDDDRKEHIRRIGETAKLMMQAGIVTIVSVISPFKEGRCNVRNLFRNGDFIEIYCNASIETCESRDVKGLYKQARSGKIKNYTGVDSIYEVPENPELIVNTDNESVQQSSNKILDFLKNKILPSDS